ncbi:MAG TPA: phage holin family protein [Pyrinomonadaceae bacterium]|nr:phage holin family protein [Pyrinomonadaceae bacterium]
MAELERRANNTAAAAATAPSEFPARTPTQSEIDGLPALVGRLGDDVMTLVDAKLGLIKVELKEEAAVYARGAALIAVGAVLAAIGFALVQIAVAFFISSLFSFDERINYALGFLITGALYLIVGGILALVMKNRLAAHDPTPERTVEEIRKDKQWLKKEM